MVEQNKTVLITGAGGFIGGHVVRIFAQNNWKILAVVHKNIPEELYLLPDVEIIRADITDAKKLKSIPCADVVVQIAGRASDIGEDKIFQKINFEPVKTLCRLAKSKFIYISSTDVYGIRDFEGEDEETAGFEPNPINPYQKYKIESEKWIRANLEKDKYVIIRPAAVWGEGDTTLEKRVVDFLRHSPYIVYFGKWKGKNRWPMADVKNVAKAIYAVSTTDDFNGSAINIIDEKHTTIEAFYKDVAQKHFPEKKFKTLYLPLWAGLLIGGVSTFISNALKLKTPCFDPSLYAMHHVSSNLDFSCKKLQKLNR